MSLPPLPLPPLTLPPLFTNAQTEAVRRIQTLKAEKEALEAQLKNMRSLWEGKNEEFLEAIRESNRLGRK